MIAKRPERRLAITWQAPSTRHQHRAPGTRHPALKQQAPVLRRVVAHLIELLEQSDEPMLLGVERAPVGLERRRFRPFPWTLTRRGWPVDDIRSHASGRGSFGDTSLETGPRGRGA